MTRSPIELFWTAKKEQFIFEPCENFYLSYPPLNSGPSSDVVAKLSEWRESAEAAHAGGELVGGGAGRGGEPHCGEEDRSNKITPGGGGLGKGLWLQSLTTLKGR